MNFTDVSGKGPEKEKFVTPSGGSVYIDKAAKIEITGSGGNHAILDKEGNPTDETVLIEGGALIWFETEGKGYFAQFAKDETGERKFVGYMSPQGEYYGTFKNDQDDSKTFVEADQP